MKAKVLKQMFVEDYKTSEKVVFTGTIAECADYLGKVYQSLKNDLLVKKVTPSFCELTADYGLGGSINWFIK